MKFVYTAIYQDFIPNTALGLSIAYQNAMKGIYEPPRVRKMVGEEFVGTKDDAEVKLTNYEPRRNDPGYLRMRAMQDLAGFFGGHCNS